MPGSPASKGGEADRRDLRAHARFRVNDAPAVVYPEKFLNKLGLARGNRAREAVNLSEGGVLVSLKKPIEEGTRVRLRVEVESFGDVIECAGEVKWCRPAAQEGTYYAGLKFLDLDPAAVRRITHLRDVLKSPEYKSKRGTKRQSKPPTLETPH